jgi:hypothetical protein
MIYINMDSVSLASKVTLLREAAVARGDTQHTLGGFCPGVFLFRTIFIISALDAGIIDLSSSIVDGH